MSSKSHCSKSPPTYSSYNFLAKKKSAFFFVFEVWKLIAKSQCVSYFPDSLHNLASSWSSLSGFWLFCVKVRNTRNLGFCSFFFLSIRVFLNCTTRGPSSERETSWLETDLSRFRFRPIRGEYFWRALSLRGKASWWWCWPMLRREIAPGFLWSTPLISAPF